MRQPGEQELMVLVDGKQHMIKYVDNNGHWKDLGILNEEGLLPCPFCGEYPYITIVEPHTHYFATFMPDSDGSIFVECSGCSCAIAYDGTDKQQAIDDWNRRE